ncbi:collagen alpha-1(I) chain-like [Enhydra lutris kenyoni]|uniref:Collagen alpha-1(I) chain-like n=1 Tax=Enhydra lutris kenyoni TaxID=391180 RepID=A0A2Y9J681_ENHLU|nr:collagen alpha-1(I) chain-like [Enhydra lutris kenyoni]
MSTILALAGRQPFSLRCAARRGGVEGAPAPVPAPSTLPRSLRTRATSSLALRSNHFPGRGSPLRGRRRSLRTLPSPRHLHLLRSRELVPRPPASPAEGPTPRVLAGHRGHAGRVRGWEVTDQRGTHKPESTDACGSRAPRPGRRRAAPTSDRRGDGEGRGRGAAAGPLLGRDREREENALEAKLACGHRERGAGVLGGANRRPLCREHALRPRPVPSEGAGSLPAPPPHPPSTTSPRLRGPRSARVRGQPGASPPGVRRGRPGACPRPPGQLEAKPVCDATLRPLRWAATRRRRPAGRGGRRARSSRPGASATGRPGRRGLPATGSAGLGAATPSGRPPAQPTSLRAGTSETRSPGTERVRVTVSHAASLPAGRRPGDRCWRGGGCAGSRRRTAPEHAAASSRAGGRRGRRARGRSARSSASPDRLPRHRPRARLGTTGTASASLRPARAQSGAATTSSFRRPGPEVTSCVRDGRSRRRGRGAREGGPAGGRVADWRSGDPSSEARRAAVPTPWSRSAGMGRWDAGGGCAAVGCGRRGAAGRGRRLGGGCWVIRPCRLPGRGRFAPARPAAVGPALGAAARPSPAVSSLWCPAGRSGRSRRLLRARPRPDVHASAVLGARPARRRVLSLQRGGCGDPAGSGPGPLGGPAAWPAQTGSQPRRAGTPGLPTARGCWGRRGPGAGGACGLSRCRASNSCPDLAGGRGRGAWGGRGSPC